MKKDNAASATAARSQATPAQLGPQQAGGPAPVDQLTAQRGYMGSLNKAEPGQTGAAKAPAPAATKSSVRKPPGKMGSLEAMGAWLGSFQVARGEFVDLEVWLDVPFPQLPGSTGRFGLKGTYCCDQSGKKELSLAVDGGLSWELFKVIKASVRLQTALKLTGEDMGAAFVDALKQNLLLQLKMTGIDAQVHDLARLAKDGPGFWDFAKALVPVYGTYEAAKIAIAKLGKDKVLELHAAYGNFFHNNPNVGFESSVAVVADGEVGAKTKGRGALEARTGLEDVGDKKAETFAEVAGEVMLSNNNNLARVRVSRRRRQSGDDIVKLDLSGQYSVTRSIAGAAGTKLANYRALFQAVKSLYVAVKGQQQGKTIPQISGVANAMLSGFAALGVAGKNLDFLQGLDVNFTWTNGQLSNCSGRLKNMTQMGTGTGNAVGPVEANLQVGTFIDVSKEFAAAAAG